VCVWRFWHWEVHYSIRFAGNTFRGVRVLLAGLDAKPVKLLYPGGIWVAGFRAAQTLDCPSRPMKFIIKAIFFTSRCGTE